MVQAVLLLGGLVVLAGGLGMVYAAKKAETDNRAPLVGLGVVAFVAVAAVLLKNAITEWGSILLAGGAVLFGFGTSLEVYRDGLTVKTLSELVALTGFVILLVGM